MPILFYRRNSDDSFQDPVPIDRAFFRKGKKDAPLEGGVRTRQSQRTWKIVPSDIGDDPKVEDVIQETASGLRWSIDSIDSDEYGQFHVLQTTEEV